VIGSGAFGSVHKGSLDIPNQREIEVAVKSVKGEITQEDRVKFLQEVVIMGQFRHPNIIKILGVVLQDSVGL